MRTAPKEEERTWRPASQPSQEGCECLHSSQLLLERDRSLCSFPTMFIFSSVRSWLFSANRDELLKSKTKSSPVVHNSQYVHLHFLLNTFMPARAILSPFSPFRVRSHREGHREWRWLSAVNNTCDYTHAHKRMHTHILPTAFGVTQACPELTVIFLYCDTGYIFQDHQDR